MPYKSSILWTKCRNNNIIYCSYETDLKLKLFTPQFVKDEIDDIRDSLDRLEAEGERRKAKLLEQVKKKQIRKKVISGLR